MKAEQEFKDVVFDEPAILLKINKRYKEWMTPKQIYHETKNAWTRRLEIVKKIKLACAVDGGMIKGVFRVDEWSYYPHTGRMRKIQFEGGPARKEIWDKYIGKSVAEWKGRNPTKIVGPKQD